jgi:hypothetical protein
MSNFWVLFVLKVFLFYPFNNWTIHLIMAAITIWNLDRISVWIENITKLDCLMKKFLITFSLQNCLNGKGIQWNVTIISHHHPNTGLIQYSKGLFRWYQASEYWTIRKPDTFCRIRPVLLDWTILYKRKIFFSPLTLNGPAKWNFVFQTTIVEPDILSGF